MITGNGWATYSIWEHSTRVKELYTRRCRDEEPEMTCAAQAADLLAPLVRPGESLLDAGCGSGYFFHSLRRRGIPVEYYGIDAAPSLIAIGRTYLRGYGLSAERLQVMRIEDLDGAVDHVVCMNVLSNIDNYHRPLERLLRLARRSVILRESCQEEAAYAYVRDKYLDEGVDLNVYVNTYATREIVDFMTSYGFGVRCVGDRHTGGQPELVIDYPHHWTFFVAERRGSESR